MILRRLFLSCALVCTASVAPGCGDEGSSGSSGTGATAASSGSAGFEAFYNEYTSLVCTGVAPCCAQMGYDGSGSQCRLLYTSFKAQVSSEAAAAYDPAKGQACLAELKAAMASGADACKGTSQPASCDGVVKGGSAGKKQPGETCNDDDECAAPMGGKGRCKSSSTGMATTRTCVEQLLGGDGASPCYGEQKGDSWFTSGTIEESTYYVCDADSEIRCDSKSKKCVKRASQGGACSSTNECLSTLRCSMGECGEKLAAGSDCVFGDDCAAGLYCEQAMKKCTAQLEDGAACTDSRACKGGGCVNMKCEKEAGLEGFGYGLLCGEKK